ncbi:MAG: hypothetical protein Q4C99_02210, partial [Clostridia bacterium]|nr:hypothetical protein [Clostridia bacterium]
TPVCTRCGQKQTAEIVHKEWIEGYYTHRVITAGTCITGEIYIDTCTICNKTTGNSQGEPLGHEYRMLRVYNESVSTDLNSKLNVEPYSIIYSCKHCGSLASQTGAQLFYWWDNSYTNTEPSGRVSNNNSSYLDVNNDEIINAKDYALIYNLNKSYLKYQEEQQNKTEESTDNNQ